MTDDTDGRRAFRERGLRAKRSFGQCFLADPNIARNIAIEATTPEGGTCLEIGPGTGALTKHLLQRATRVVAIERDRDLIPLLQTTFARENQDGRLVLIEGDAATEDWLSPIATGVQPRVIVGNVPYSITGRLLERAIHLADKVDRVVFMVQKEVADRIAAAVGTKDYGALSIFVQEAFTLQKRMFVSSSCFRPRPEVDSTVIVLDTRGQGREVPSAVFYALVTAAFSKRRKTLRNAWKGWRGLSAEHVEAAAAIAGISLDARAETIHPAQFVAMAAALPLRG